MKSRIVRTGLVVLFIAAGCATSTPAPITSVDVGEPQTWGAASDAGIKYYSVPISRSGYSFDPKSMSKISAIVQDHHQQNILLHCSSGNRASAWLAVHLTEDHGLPIDASLAVAKKAGLTNSDVEARVVQFLNEPGSSGQ